MTLCPCRTNSHISSINTRIEVIEQRIQAFESKDKQRSPKIKSYSTTSDTCDAPTMRNSNNNETREVEAVPDTPVEVHISDSEESEFDFEDDLKQPNCSPQLN